MKIRITKETMYMNVLTPENTAFEIDLVTDIIPEEMFCVLDLSEHGDSDFYFKNILINYNFAITVFFNIL